MSKIHPTADVQTRDVGEGTTIWQYVVILFGARIGKDCNINAQCLIEGDVVVGDRVTVKSGTQLWNGVRLGNDVFIGPNVTFTNDKFPRSKQYPERFLETRIDDGASVGGGAVILPGITIGKGAMIGAGAVVTRSVPPYAVVVGSPARITNYIDARKQTPQATSAVFSTDISAKQIGVSGVTLHHMKLIGDIRGDLSAGEFPANIPFQPRRYFLVFNVPSVKVRGEHAHRQCHQFLICAKGNCAVVVDDGINRAEVLLDAPNKGIYLPPLIWGIQYKYSHDAVLLVFTSHVYDAGDYIRDYNEFLTLAGKC